MRTGPPCIRRRHWRHFHRGDYEKFMSQNLRPRSAGLFWLTLAALPALHADVTLRYKTEVEVNPNLPQQMTQPIMKFMDMLPPADTRQFKNGKMFYSGSQTSI